MLPLLKGSDSPVSSSSSPSVPDSFTAPSVSRYRIVLQKSKMLHFYFKSGNKGRCPDATLSFLWHFYSATKPSKKNLWSMNISGWPFKTKKITFNILNNVHRKTNLWGLEKIKPRFQLSISLPVYIWADSPTSALARLLNLSLTSVGRGGRRALPFHS